MGEIGRMEFGTKTDMNLYPWDKHVANIYVATYMCHKAPVLLYKKKQMANFYSDRSLYG